jgi:hypothetical protein
MIGQGHLTRLGRAHRNAGGGGFVRIVHHTDRVACELVGVVRHRPVCRPVSLSTATALVASGTPVVVRRCSCVAAPAVDHGPPATAPAVDHGPPATASSAR